MKNLPKVVAQQRRGRASNPRLLDRKSDALPLSHRATTVVVHTTIKSKAFRISFWFAETHTHSRVENNRLPALAITAGKKFNRLPSRFPFKKCLYSYVAYSGLAQPKINYLYLPSAKRHLESRYSGERCKQYHT